MKVQPNFEDEVTLLTARRVVPLAKLEAKERQRKHWFLGGAFAVAMLLGAASALLATYVKLRNVPASQAEASKVDPPAEQVAVAEDAAASELPAVENTEEAQNTEELVAPVTPKNNTEEAQNTEELVAPVTPKKAPVVTRRAPVRQNTDSVRPRVLYGGDDEDETLDRIREAVLYDAWEERRARRAARRERRNRLNHSDRDLSNLDEIFEGRRPRP